MTEYSNLKPICTKNLYLQIKSYYFSVYFVTYLSLVFKLTDLTILLLLELVEENYKF